MWFHPAPPMSFHQCWQGCVSYILKLYQIYNCHSVYKFHNSFHIPVSLQVLSWIIRFHRTSGSCPFFCNASRKSWCNCCKSSWALALHEQAQRNCQIIGHKCTCIRNKWQTDRQQFHFSKIVITERLLQDFDYFSFLKQRVTFLKLLSVCAVVIGFVADPAVFASALFLPTNSRSVQWHAIVFLQELEKIRFNNG